MVYKPSIQLLVDWDGDGSYDHLRSDVYGDAFGVDLKYGIEVAVDQSIISFVSARGELELFNRGGRYSSEGPGAFDASALRKRQGMRVVLDGDVVWQGLVEPFQPADVPGDVQRALGRLRGSQYDELVEVREYVNQGGAQDDVLFQAALTAWGATRETLAVDASRVPQGQWQWYHTGDRSGAVIFEGSLRRFLSDFARWAIGYSYETWNGEIAFISRDRYRQRDRANPAPTPLVYRDVPPSSGNLFAAGSQDAGSGASAALDVLYPALRNYPRVAGVRNKLDGESLALQLQEHETFWVLNFDLAAGQSTNRLLRVEDETINQVINWRTTWTQTPSPDGNQVLAPAVAAASYTLSGSLKEVNVTVRNNSARSVTLSVTVQGQPYQVSSAGLIKAEDEASQAAYGVLDASDETPAWFYTPGQLQPATRRRTSQAQCDSLIAHAKDPVGFLRIGLPLWQESEALAKRVIALRVGQRVRVSLPSEATGDIAVREEMLVAALRYSYRLGRMPVVEVDLLSFPWGAVGWPPG